MLTQPPVSTIAALGTNATFSCRGIGRVLWQINGTQVKGASQPPVFAIAQIFVPIPRDNFSELIITVTRETNATLVIICLIDPVSGVGDSVRSDPVQLLVYGMFVYGSIHSLSSKYTCLHSLSLGDNSNMCSRLFTGEVNLSIVVSLPSNIIAEGCRHLTLLNR